MPTPPLALSRRRAETGYSRFPIYREHISAPMGYVHIKDALCNADRGARDEPVDPSLIRAFADVAHDDLCTRPLEKLQHRGTHMARVVEDRGGVVGLVPLEDVLEELIGEIDDAAHHDET